MVEPHLNNLQLNIHMPLVDRLLSIGPVRKAIWKLWYPFLTSRVRGEEVIFLNYAFEADPPMGIALTPEDEPNRACIQLYHHVGSQADISGKKVLEVSCGHGGGASYLTRTMKPAAYTGLDLNPAGIDFCKKRHHVEGLGFIQGDAENLPFPADSFDVVVNVEASHCYPDFPRFMAEVARVLKPGGHFLYADFRFSEKIADWEDALEKASLQKQRGGEIGADVLRGMEYNSPRSLELLDKKLPKFLHGLGRDFAGVKGSRVYNAIVDGELSYRSYCFLKV